MTAPVTHGSWVTWVMGQELNGSLGSWVTLGDPFPALVTKVHQLIYVAWCVITAARNLTNLFDLSPLRRLQGMRQPKCEEPPSSAAETHQKPLLYDE